MTVLLFLVAFITILIIIWYALYYKYDRYLKTYPGPTPLPILGHALYFKSLKDVIPSQLKLLKEYGSVVKIQIGYFPPLILIADPRLVEKVLGSTKILNKSIDYSYMHHWLGTGLLTSGPAKWRIHRKILTPGFHFQILEQFTPTFNLYADILVNKMKQVVGKPSTDIYPFVSLCTLDIICATSMGTAVNAQLDGTSKYVKSVQEMSHIVMGRMVSLVPDFLYPFTPTSRTEAKLVKILHEYTNSVIASRKHELQSLRTPLKKDDDSLGIKERRTFLDILLQYKLEGGTITDEEIREEVDTFMFEGHDTTSAAIGFTLYCLANYSEAQQKSVDELNSIFADDAERSATTKDLNEMKYLEMVIKESNRLYPPVPMFGRSIHEDMEFNGSTIPKNTSLSIFAYGIHHNPEVYPDPERFDPERFTTEQQAERSPYAYVPFSAGSRNCIGQRFAMLEVKAVISKILRTFELLPAEPKHELALVPALILKASSGICIRLENRK